MSRGVGAAASFSDSTYDSGVQKVRGLVSVG